MDSKILYLNLFVIFILLLIIAVTLIIKKENLKARLSFCFFFLNIIVVCIANLFTFYYGNYKLIFVQISLGGLTFLYGPMLLQYVFFSLEQKLPKYWVLNYWVVLLIFISGFYYLFIPESVQKEYLQEMISGSHLPTVLLGIFTLFHSIFYFVYVRFYLNKLRLNPDDIKLVIKQKWASNFVNYMILCNVIIIIYYIVTIAFYPDLLVFGDLVIVPLIILAIYSFIVLQSSLQHKEAEFKYILSQVERQNELLQQRLSISRDLHDNIGSQLTFIISSVENIKYAYDLKDDALATKLNHVSSFARETIVELRDTVWALKSSEMILEDLEMRINDFMLKAKKSQENMHFSFSMPEDLKNKKMSTIEGMNIYRTIQEAVHNAFKHSQANSIKIDLKKIDNRLMITINDDGVGFDVNTVAIGNGLQNMRKRTHQIGGEFNLNSTVRGTKVTILV